MGQFVSGRSKPGQSLRPGNSATVKQCTYQPDEGLHRHYHLIGGRAKFSGEDHLAVSLRKKSIGGRMLLT